MGRIKEKLHEVISEAETPQGKLFDVVLLLVILLSIAVVFLESIPEIRSEHVDALRLAEYGFTAIFTVEYILRLVAAGKAWKYAGSFFGVVDLLSILPTFVELLLPGMASLRVIRVLRLLRVFKVFKMVSFASEATALMDAVKGARNKILVFMSTVLVLVTILGTLVYIVEEGGGEFTSIPRSIYWAIVTVTTVGYGDIVPSTVLGQTIACIIMLIGFAIIAVPTGIVSAEMVSSANKRKGKFTNTHICKKCSAEGHDDEAVHCNKCGGVL